MRSVHKILIIFKKNNLNLNLFLFKCSILSSIFNYGILIVYLMWKVAHNFILKKKLFKPMKRRYKNNGKERGSYQFNNFFIN
jgi:ABC-type uncharacterized transport system permease subunit